ncbi:MAG: MFS transporter [Actinomycetota bacterium]|nr:MFS transporter [Actinomycetota bacterium]
MIPLSRNRNYRLLWGSQILAEFGSSASAIAFPLLVLGVTGSPAASGLVLSVIATARLVAGLPMGALADRWNRKRIMLGCEAASMVAGATLVAALVWDVVTLGHIVAVAAVMGLSSALFEPAEDACLPNLVPADQLPAAVAMNSARSFLGHLSGTAAGGFFFALGRVVPFAAETVTHALSFVGLTFLRVPAREVRREPGQHLGHEMAAGVRWVWQHRPIRVIALCAVGLNLFIAAYYVVIILLAKADGVPAGEIGVMAAMLGVGGLLGTLVAPYAQRRVTPYQSMMCVFWVLTALTPVAVVTRSAYVMGGVFAAMAFVAPTANTTIETYGLLLTPDDLRGRLSGVMSAVTGVAAAVGPALGGVLLEVVSDRQAVLLCTAGIGIVTLLATASRTLRSFPHYTDDEALAVTAGADQPVTP